MICCYTFPCPVMLFYFELFLFLSEISACIESILLSLLVLSIFWQHLCSLRKGSQPAKRAKAEAGVGGEGWGKRDQEFSQPVSQGTQLVPRGQASVSQYLINKWTQLLSFSQPHFTEFYLGREMTWLFLKFQWAFQLITML